MALSHPNAAATATSFHGCGSRKRARSPRIRIITLTRPSRSARPNTIAPAKPIPVSDHQLPGVTSTHPAAESLRSPAPSSTQRRSRSERRSQAGAQKPSSPGGLSRSTRRAWRFDWPNADAEEEGHSPAQRHSAGLGKSRTPTMRAQYIQGTKAPGTELCASKASAQTPTAAFVNHADE